MANETVITVVGNLTDAPELRFTPNGAAVANFTVASTPRQFDRQSNEFKDGETLFLRCSAWKELGENCAESLQRGTRVVVQGRLKSRSFETKEGEKRTVMELDVDDIGPSLRRATAVVTKIQSGGGGFSGQQNQQGGNFGGQQSQQGGFGNQQNNPQQGGNWGNQQQAQQSSEWGQNPGGGFGGQGGGDDSQQPF